MPKNPEQAGALEKIIDQHLSDLVALYSGGRADITSKVITSALKGAYQKALADKVIDKATYKEFTVGEANTDSVPQDSLYEKRLDGTKLVAKEGPKGKEDFYKDIEEVFQGLMDRHLDAGDSEAADKVKQEIEEMCYTKEDVYKDVEVPQPNKDIPNGTFKPSKIEQAVQDAMMGKDNISVPKFKETVWQKVKNALHIGKGHEARKQEHAKSFSEDKVKPLLPQDLLDTAKKIGKTTIGDSASKKSTSQSRPPSESRGR